MANLGYTGATNANYITNNNQLTNGAGYTTYTANQSLNTSNSPSFAGVNINGNLNAVDNIYLANALYHEGDTNTYLVFGTDTITLATAGSSEVTVNSTGVRLGDTGNGYFQPVTGNYGSVQIDGGAHTGYEGYSIGGRAVFMHDNSSTMGLYDDVNNEWGIRYTFNGAAELFYNGVTKLQTISNGVNISGDLNAVDNVYVANAVLHEGDTDTYMQFHAADQWRVVTGGTERLEVNNSAITASTDIIIAGTGNYLQFPDGTQQTTAATGGGASYLQAWVGKDSGTANTLNSVAGDGSGNWVAVGSSGVVCRSTNNGSTWAAATVSGATTFQDVATDGSGNWVAVGGNGQVYYSSNAGSTWTAGTSGVGSNEITGVATDGSGNWLFVDNGGQCRKSTNNGSTWSYLANPGGATSTLRGIRYGNGSWLTWNSSNVLYRSTNTGTSFAYEESINIKEKAVGTDGAGNWIVGRDGGLVYKSTDDGATWAFTGDYGFGNGSGTNSPTTIAGSGDGVVIVNRSNESAPAGGGLTFLIYDDSGDFGDYSTSSSNSGNFRGWRGMSSDGAGSWVGVGSSGAIGVAQE